MTAYIWLRGLAVISLHLLALIGTGDAASPHRPCSCGERQERQPTYILSLPRLPTYLWAVSRTSFAASVAGCAAKLWVTSSDEDVASAGSTAEPQLQHVVDHEHSQPTESRFGMEDPPAPGYFAGDGDVKKLLEWFRAHGGMVMTMVVI